MTFFNTLDVLLHFLTLHFFLQQSFFFFFFFFLDTRRILMNGLLFEAEAAAAARAKTKTGDRLMRERRATAHLRGHHSFHLDIQFMGTGVSRC
jgi:hypothetical protein